MANFVPPLVRQIAKSLRTVVALVRPFLGMNSHVRFQIRRTFEALLAFSTGELTLRRMHPEHMDVVVAFLRKRFVALVALERFIRTEV